MNLNTNREVRSEKCELTSHLRIIEVALVVCGHAWQKIKERIEASVECATKLRNRAVDRVQSQAGALTVTQCETRLLGVDECAFWNEPDAIDERVTGHIKSYLRNFQLPKP
jgi:hypothetical protein